MPREKSKMSLEDLNNQDFKTGEAIRPGTYPARFIKFGEPFVLQSQFGKSAVFKAYFLVRNSKTQEPQAVERLLSVPTRGVIHKMSKLYGLLKALDNGRCKYIDDNGKIVNGFRLLGVEKGETCTVEIELNKNDFPTIKSISRPAEGMTFPDVEEWDALEEEELAGAPEGDEDIPF